jgi:hypothetical protein
MSQIARTNAKWECPYCRKAQIVLSANHSRNFTKIDNDHGEFGGTGLFIETVVCANEECQRMSLQVGLWRRELRNGNYVGVESIHEWRLLPESSAKPLPAYIPAPVAQDYTEACRIRDLSPKASATLSRRCLQGMIRDFCGIARKTLFAEISDLRTAVDEGNAPRGVQADTIDAIDHVRSIGNIGAHMEADINTIIDVDPDEAQALIGLLELLFEEWYIDRQKRTERLAAIGLVAADKKAAKLAAPQKQLPAPGAS